jgi:hypothetical protein
LAICAIGREEHAESEDSVGKTVVITIGQIAEIESRNFDVVT